MGLWVHCGFFQSFLWCFSKWQKVIKCCGLYFNESCDTYRVSLSPSVEKKNVAEKWQGRICIGVFSVNISGPKVPCKNVSIFLWSLEMLSKTSKTFLNHVYNSRSKEENRQSSLQRLWKACVKNATFVSFCGMASYLYSIKDVLLDCWVIFFQNCYFFFFSFKLNLMYYIANIWENFT